ncbi:MAG: hypothetical protein MI700_02100, partial [Balneolales bacterium]|nr:hypothetical protein [Balneolales bacterium]
MKYTFISRAFSFLLFCFTLHAVQVHAQTANFELAERFTTQKMDKLMGTVDVFPRWIEDSDDFWYEYENADGTFWYYVDIESRSQRVLFDNEDLAGKLSEEFKRPFNAKDL